MSDNRVTIKVNAATFTEARSRAIEAATAYYGHTDFVSDESSATPHLRSGGGEVVVWTVEFEFTTHEEDIYRKATA